MPLGPNTDPLEVFIRREMQQMLKIPAKRLPIAVNDLDYFPIVSSSEAPNICFRYKTLKFSHTYSG